MCSLLNAIIWSSKLYCFPKSFTFFSPASTRFNVNHPCERCQATETTVFFTCAFRITNNASIIGEEQNKIAPFFTKNPKRKREPCSIILNKQTFHLLKDVCSVRRSTLENKRNRLVKVCLQQLIIRQEFIQQNRID